MGSTKSMLAPARYGAHIRSTTTLTPPKSETMSPSSDALVEEQLVAQAGATARLYGDAQPEVVATLLLDQGFDLRGGDIGEHDAVGAWPRWSVSLETVMGLLLRWWVTSTGTWTVR